MTKYAKNADGLYVCPVCGETKARANTMYYHVLRHSGEAKHVCPVDGCGKGFIQKSGLTQHMAQAHPRADEPVFSCPCCPHTTRMKANLLIHIGRMHGKGWIPEEAGTGACECSQCNRAFSSTTAYYYHAVRCFVAKAPVDLEQALAALA